MNASSQPFDKPTESRTASLLSPITQSNLIGICILALTFGTIGLLEFLPAIWALLSASLIITYLLLGPVSGIEKFLYRVLPGKLRNNRGLQKTLAILIVYLLGGGLLFFSAFRIALPLSIQLKEFAKEMPGSISGAQPRTASQLKKKLRYYLSAPQTTSASKPGTLAPLGNAKPVRNKVLKSTLQLMTRKIVDISQSYASKLGGYLLNLGGATLSGIIYILTMLVLVFYLLHDGAILKQGLVNLLPQQYEPQALNFLTRLHQHFYVLVGGQAVMGVLGGSLMYILMLCFGLKYALMLGVVFGVASILPVLGPWLGLIPIIVMIELQGMPATLLPLGAGIGLFYLLKTYWLWPRLISTKVYMHPLLFLVCFLACIQVIGLPGLLLAFPLASLLSVVLNELKAQAAQ